MTFISNSHARTCSPAPRRVTISNLLSLYRQRRELGQLDAERLEDLGLSVTEARTEASRPFWDVPTHWVK